VEGRCIKKIEEVDRFEDSWPGFYTFSGKPQVLPVLVHRYKVDKQKIDEDQGNFIYSIHYIIEKFKEKSELELVPDGEGNHVVPFCRNLSRAPQVSHIYGIPHVHLLEPEKKMCLKKLGAYWCGKKNAANGNRDVNIAKACFERLACFLEKERLACFPPPGGGGGGGGRGRGAGGAGRRQQHLATEDASKMSQKIQEKRKKQASDEEGDGPSRCTRAKGRK